MSDDNNYCIHSIDGATLGIGERPAAPDRAAYYGIAGEFVRLVEPHTEADSVGILAQLLIAFGNVVGRHAHFTVEATKHCTNLFAVMVGQSSRSRKGTSWDHVMRLLSEIAADWQGERVQSGLSSGEGVIPAVGDARVKQEPIRQRGAIVGYQDVVVDPGVADKRLLLVEPEFVRTLKVMSRESSTLSSILRQAWDTGNLKVITKDPYQATNAHISVIGHITREELQRNLTDTDTANGFANRFLWFHVCRSKLLPNGGALNTIEMKPVMDRLREAILYAKAAGIMRRDVESNVDWVKAYPVLTGEKGGIFGSITSRSEAQVLRLSMLYALLDSSSVIRKPHLAAALAVWEYVEDSVRYIFGDTLGDSVADSILTGLRASSGGMTRTEISGLLGRNYKAERIAGALSVLYDHGLVTREVTDTNGRPAELWRARQ